MIVRFGMLFAATNGGRDLDKGGIQLGTVEIGTGEICP